MASLPVIVGFGGISAAGRSSFHHAYRRMMVDSLDTRVTNESYLDLAMLMGLLNYGDQGYQTPEGEAVDVERWLADNRGYINDHTLVRQLEDNLFDPQAMLAHVAPRIKAGEGDEISFVLRSRYLPKFIPDNWHIESFDDKHFQVKVTVKGALDILLPDRRKSLVNSAGQLPSGFNPARLYPSRNHPRGLQLTIYAASDAVQSMGISWEQILNKISPDEMAVYASSAMSQLDENGNGGLLQSSLRGKRVTSKQLPLGFPEMPADFVNAYVIGSIGGTGANVGACATFLYNLRQGIDDIRSGNKRVVLVGGGEAPITPEVIEGYRTMGALADDDSLLALDEGASSVDHRRACRPFSNNCGFTMAEAAQFVVLFDDELTLELGANIHGAVGDVFINADGFKKSISSPGVGNYITMAKAMASVRAILGDSALQNSYVQAHGTGTPQNRVTESHILNEMAKTFDINNWPVTAIKSYVGHSLAVAAGDQLVTSLGTWQYGLIPGIKTIDHVADDVDTSKLNILMTDLEVGTEGMDAVVLNSKGFGGNNASASILAPHKVKDMLIAKHGESAFNTYRQANETVAESANAYDERARKGLADVKYCFGEGVKGAEDVRLSRTEISVAGFSNSISLELGNPYAED